MIGLTLPQWLSKLYRADLHGTLVSTILDFKVALAENPELKLQAEAELERIDELISARGRGACAFSAKYHDYLHEAFNESN